MRITIIYRYFWPDAAPYGLLLKELLPQLSAAGHEIDVLAAQPAYAQDAKSMVAPRRSVDFGCNVRRIRLLPRHWPGASAVSYGLFPIAAALSVLFGKKRDVVWSGTTPPVVQSLLVFAAAKMRGMKTIYQMQDIYPEIAIHSELMQYGPLSRLMRRLDNVVIRMADRVVVLSADMQDVIRDATGHSPVVINNFAMGTDSGLPPPLLEAGCKRFVFAGNLGRFQNLENVLEAFLLIDPANAELHFVGEGKAEEGLRQRVAEAGADNVFFHGRVSPEAAYAYMRQCDVGIVSLKPGLYRYAYPAKTNSYLAAGLKVFACVEEESAMGSMLVQNDLGCAVSWDGGVERMAAAMQDLISGARLEKRASGPDAVWSAQYAGKRWIELLEGLEAAS